MTTPVEVDHRIRIQAPRERVWRAMVELDEVRQWMFPSMEVVPGLGGRWEFTFPHWPSARGLTHPALGMGGPIVAWEEGRVLGVDFRPPYWGTLRFALADAPEGGTDLRVTHDGFEGNEEWEADFRGGWGSFTDRLAVLCETGSPAEPAADQRSLSVSTARCDEATARAALLRSLPRRGWVPAGDAHVAGPMVVQPCRPGVAREDPEPFVRAFERAFCSSGRLNAASYLTPNGTLALAGPPYPRPFPMPLARLPQHAVARFRELAWQPDGTLTADWRGSGWVAGRDQGTSAWTFGSCGRIERLVLKAEPARR